MKGLLIAAFVCGVILLIIEIVEIVERICEK